MSDEKTKGAVQIMRFALLAAAVLVLVAGCAVAGIMVTQSGPTTNTLLVAAVAVVSGLVLAVLLIVASSIAGMLAVLVGRVAAPADDVRPALERLEQSLRVLNNLQGRGAAEGRDGGFSTGGRSVPALEQLRDITLMSDEQRQNYAKHHWEQRKRTHVEAIDREVLVGDWAAAFSRLEELQVVLPMDPQVAELRGRVESEQNSRLEEDVRIARNRIKQLMTAGSAAGWTQAEDLAGALQVKYPGKAEAVRLAEDVRREREAWERENADRLFRDITAATEKRQWRQALLAVEEFIRRYSLDARAEALRLDLPMLQENAGAQERKEQEEHFKDLLKRQRYDEALTVARAVLHKYPHSPTAQELTKLLPRVEEMARQEAAKQAASAGVAVGAG